MIQAFDPEVYYATGTRDIHYPECENSGLMECICDKILEEHIRRGHDPESSEDLPNPIEE